ncbi:unknown [Eggerthella sp. CAG:209]|nr:unknown [Eggerthella sp. CAG:209]
MQIWRCVNLPVSVARDKPRINLCAVLVFDRYACAYVVARTVSAEKRKLRCKKKILYSPLFVEVDDPRHYRERWIVKHRAAFGIVEILEIAAREKRSNAFVLVYTVSVTRPFLHSLIHIIGRIAIICGQLRLELACKRFVILIRCSSIGR